MLAATQLGVGIMAAAPLAGESPIGRLSSIGNWGAAALQFAGDLLNIIATNTIFTIGLGLFFAGLGASVTHLGKPLRAWRFFLGLKTSWLSREILVFSAAAPLALLALVLPDSLTVRLLLTVTGLLGVLCSAMIYIDTRRRFWAAPNTLVRFLGTTTLGALAVSLPAAAAAVMIAKILAEFALGAQPLTTRNLLRGPLRLHVVSRSAVAALATAAFAFGLGLPGLALLIAGEIAERILFFKAVDAPKMPGQPGTI
jgi:DMSO reductase anchor subunit